MIAAAKIFDNRAHGSPQAAFRASSASTAAAASRDNSRHCLLIRRASRTRTVS
jgi:hypothetical protein